MDGRYSTSKIVATTGKEKGFEINSVTPSLVNTITTVSIASAIADKAQIAIANFQGIVVKKISVALSTLVTELQVGVSNLAKGNYILTVTNQTLNIKITRFLKL
ncbi:MAG: hypothetical protein H7320_25215 [Ferruginibacter sp.]|nr:hypothetical protein [Ferruginibacter sp.]